MEFKTLKAALINAQENMRDGVIRTHNSCVDFSFIHGGSSEDNIIGYDNKTRTMVILGKTCNTYIDCDAVECIEVYRN